MIRRNKLILKLTAATLCFGIITSIPQNVFATEYSSLEEVNEENYTVAKDENGLEWRCFERNDGTIAIRMETKDLPETIKVPAELNGRKVSYLVAINKSAFRLSDENYQIKEKAKKVKTIIIPEGITRLGYLDYCVNVENISLPSSLMVVSKDSFPENWLDSNRDSNGLVIKQGILIDGYKASGDINIPSEVRSIADYAFRYNENITSMQIPSSVKRIGKSAISGCTNLTKVTMNEGLEFIGYEAFSGCCKLKEAVIPASATQLEDNIFFLDRELENTTQNSNKLIIVDGVLVDGKSAKGDIIIPSNVTKIGNDAFSSNQNIKSVTMPSTVKEIGESAFSKSSIEKVKISGSIKTISWESFKHCTNLKEVEIEEGVEAIDSFAFMECSSLTKISIPNSVGKIGVLAFADCTKLNDVRYKSDIQVSNDAFAKTPWKEGNGSNTNNTDTWEGWFPKDNGWYYKYADGTLRKGWFKHTDGIWYHTNLETGRMTIGWFKDINGKWYYFDTNGARKSGWLYDGGSWYYLLADGEMAIGWIKDTDGTWYHLEGNGSMTTGWFKDTNGKWYYLYSNGSMACNTYIGGYYLGRSGAWVR